MFFYFKCKYYTPIFWMGFLFQKKYNFTLKLNQRGSLKYFYIYFKV